MEILTVAVGTLNPVKIAATREVIHFYWPRARVEGVDVPSGVSPQPWGVEEMLRGARHRAERARALLDADLGVGMEGGVEDIPQAGGVFLSGWAAVVTRSGRVSFGSGGRVLLPPRLVERLRAGEELGPAMDVLSGQVNTKHTVGSVGILTRGFVKRGSQFAVALAYALAPLLHPEWYGEMDDG
ncbi:MAG: DUF84 family protein [Chloroflexi bacterium]|nr:DUF84 family protein [Chloroflexota bacterium]